MNKNKKQKPSLKKQVAFLFSGKFVSLIFQFIIPMILVRLVSKENYGLYQTMNLLINFFGSIFLFGIASSFYYFFPISSYSEKRQLLSQSSFISIIIAIIFFIFFITFNDYLHFIVDVNNIEQYVMPIALVVVFFIISYPIENLFVVEENSKYVIFYLILNSVLRGIFIIVPIAILGDIIWAIWGLVIFNLLKSIFYFTYIIHNYKINFNFSKWKKDYLKKQFIYTYPLGLSTLVGNINTKISSLILASNFSATDFATYSVSQFRIPVINLIFPAISNVIAPKITICKKEGDIERAALLWHKMIKVMSIIVIPITIFFIIIGPELITLLYTDKYIDAVLPYRIILFTFFVQMLSRGVVLSAFGYTKYIFRIQFVSMIFSIIMAILLVPNYGVLGAAISYVISFYFSAILQLIKVKSLLHLSFLTWFPYKSLIKYFFVSSLSIPVIFLLRDFGFSVFLFLVISTILYAIITLILLIIIKEVSLREFISYIKS